jgi:hypothetical protein
MHFMLYFCHSSKSVLFFSTNVVTFYQKNELSVPDPHTYLLVLDENSLVLEDGSCILENAIVHSEDI